MISLPKNTPLTTTDDVPDDEKKPLPCSSTEADKVDDDVRECRDDDSAASNLRIKQKINGGEDNKNMCIPAGLENNSRNETRAMERREKKNKSRIKQRIMSGTGNRNVTITCLQSESGADAPVAGEVARDSQDKIKQYIHAGDRNTNIFLSPNWTKISEAEEEILFEVRRTATDANKRLRQSVQRSRTKNHNYSHLRPRWTQEDDINGQRVPGNESSSIDNHGSAMRMTGNGGRYRMRRRSNASQFFDNSNDSSPPRNGGRRVRDAVDNHPVAIELVNNAPPRDHTDNKNADPALTVPPSVPQHRANNRRANIPQVQIVGSSQELPVRPRDPSITKNVPVIRDDGVLAASAVSHQPHNRRPRDPSMSSEKVRSHPPRKRRLEQSQQAIPQERGSGVNRPRSKSSSSESNNPYRYPDIRTNRVEPRPGTRETVRLKTLEAMVDSEQEVLVREDSQPRVGETLMGGDLIREYNASGLSWHEFLNHRYQDSRLGRASNCQQPKERQGERSTRPNALRTRERTAIAQTPLVPATETNTLGEQMAEVGAPNADGHGKPAPRHRPPVEIDVEPDVPLILPAMEKSVSGNHRRLPEPTPRQSSPRHEASTDLEGRSQEPSYNLPRVQIAESTNADIDQGAVLVIDSETEGKRLNRERTLSESNYTPHAPNRQRQSVSARNSLEPIHNTLDRTGITFENGGADGDEEFQSLRAEQQEQRRRAVLARQSTDIVSDPPSSSSSQQSLDSSTRSLFTEDSQTGEVINNPSPRPVALNPDFNLTKELYRLFYPARQSRYHRQRINYRSESSPERASPRPGPSPSHIPTSTHRKAISKTKISIPSCRTTAAAGSRAQISGGRAPSTGIPTDASRNPTTPERAESTSSRSETNPGREAASLGCKSTLTRTPSPPDPGLIIRSPGRLPSYEDVGSEVDSLASTDTESSSNIVDLELLSGDEDDEDTEDDTITSGISSNPDKSPWIGNEEDKDRESNYSPQSSSSSDNSSDSGLSFEDLT